MDMLSYKKATIYNILFGIHWEISDKKEGYLHIQYRYPNQLINQKRRLVQAHPPLFFYLNLPQALLPYVYISAIYGGQAGECIRAGSNALNF